MSTVKVFVVDDDKDFAESLAILLEGHDCEVEIANSGESAVLVCHEKDFDVTLMDFMLPGMNGLEAFKAIRERKPGCNVIMMTGYSTDRFLQEAGEIGASEVLSKPLEIPTLLKFIKKIRRQLA